MRNKSLLTTGWLMLTCFATMAQTPIYLTPKESEVYKQHEAEVKANAKINGEDQISELITKYTISIDYQTSLAELINQREIRLSIYNFIYSDDALIRYKAKMEIKKSYQNKLDEILLKAGAQATTPNYSLALKFKDQLTLTESQVDTIVKKAIEINRRLERRPGFSTWPHELKTFSSVLSTKQMDELLSAKNQTKVKRSTFFMWNVLKNNKLTADIDSSITVGQLYYYYNNIEKANDLYAQNDSLKKTVLENINLSAPPAMKRYWAYRKMSKIKTTFKGNYAW